MKVRVEEGKTKRRKQKGENEKRKKEKEKELPESMWLEHRTSRTIGEY